MGLSWNSVLILRQVEYKLQYITSSKLGTFENCEIFSNFLFLVRTRLIKPPCGAAIIQITEAKEKKYKSPIPKSVNEASL